MPSLSSQRPIAGADVIGAIDPRYADGGSLPMRFYDHVTQTQIAAEIGVCQMRVSRLLKQILALLRTAMPG